MGPELPLACSLDAGALAERRGRWEAVSSRALADRSRVDGGVRLRYRAEPGIADELRELVRLEGECCAFLSFSLHEEGGFVVLDVGGPPEAASLVDEFAA
jgi:hypothetical protein